jgi:hypothetical protein
VAGDPGIVVLSGGNRLGPVHRDDELVAVAERLRPATIEQVDAVVERSREEATEASFERNREVLLETYPGATVVGRYEVGEREAVLVAGDTAETFGDQGPVDEREPRICGSWFGETAEHGLPCLRRSDWEGADVAAVGWYEGLLVAGDERLAEVAFVDPTTGDEVAGVVVPLDLGPGYPTRLGIAYVNVEMVEDPVIAPADEVVVVARDAEGVELHRERVYDLASG